MLNDRARLAVEKPDDSRSGRIHRPLYDSYCFAHLPATLEFLLTGSSDRTPLPTDTFEAVAGPWDDVVLLFVDAFGWRLFQRFAERYALLQRFLDEGIVSPLTSMFPSTTAAHMTTLHTGLLPGESGIYEWYIYEPLVDAVITPLRFCYAGEGQRETLRDRGYTGEELFPWPSLAQHLATRGVASFVYQDAAYTEESTYSRRMFQGAELLPYTSADGCLQRLVDRLLHPTAPAPRYHFVYFDTVDHLSHVHGPYSDLVTAEIDRLFTLFENNFYQHVAGRIGRALLLLSADHGQTPVDPQTTVLLNWEIPGLERYLKRTGRGQPILFAGSPRDFFLHVREARLDELREQLTEHLSGIADVVPVSELIEQGYFGPVVTDRLRERVGNLVILPARGETVYWYESGRFSMGSRGSHGGLTPEEMETGLYALALG
jgi:hypothetical protein